MFDTFVAPLRCSACSNDAPEAEIQTYLRGASADGSALRVGDPIDAPDLTTESILDAGYALVQEPEVGGPIRILDVWICPSCQTEPWAMIEIVDRRIRKITAVALDRPTLLSGHFISETNAAILADSLRGEGEGEGEDAVAVLRLRLPG
jgi:hypothetical protein